MRCRCRSLALASALSLASAPAFAGVSSGGPQPGAGAGVPVKVKLEPEADPAGKGEATLSLDARRGVICFDVDVDDDQLDPVVAVHIHAGAAGETNEDLLLVDLDFANQGLRGCTRAGRHLVRSILDNVDSNDPAQFYLHVHTSGFSTGAVRGQLVLD